MYSDKHYLKNLVASWGWMAPLVFIVIQALQVIISPIPGEITGPVGGALFGTLWGVRLLDDRPHRGHAHLLRRWAASGGSRSSDRG